MSTRTSTIKTIRTVTSAAAPIHPGQYVRDSILAPKKLSVSAAAKLVGVGRPALSNFLNGHVVTTPDMASRIEVAFSISAQSLLDMQAAYDAAQTKAKGAPANAMPYVVPFLGIKATDIEAWVTRNISARTRFSVLLRTLVNSTGSSITQIDFPGNNDAERSGWDGYIEATQPTPWIPDGLSGWEFGTNQDIKLKADGDFAKSVKAMAQAEREQMTFVFVTPWNWPGKTNWVKDNKAKSRWKDVRAYDSCDLEQWLEQSIAAQVWFANETLRPSNGVRSLDKCWADWADVASPPLVGSLFAPAIDSAKRTMLSRLSQQPPAEPTVIAADSAEEALAFLAQLLGPAGGGELESYRDRVLAFDEPGVLPKLAQGTKAFIAVTANRQVERELGTLARSMHSIFIYPRNTLNATPHVVLDPLRYDAFCSSLEEMGYGCDDVTKYSNESGQSLTVLRRRLANVPAVRMPEWAADHKTALSLIPFLFIGAWSSTNTTDQTALTWLANANSYEDLEKTCQRLAGLNDAPLWLVGTYRGVVSKIDLLFAIADSITAQDLQRYFKMAKNVLGEDDPALDLPEDERWTASIRGKSRAYSVALRKGISATLVLLAVHGNRLFCARLGFNCESEAIRLVRELLTPLKTRILEANDDDLTAYAEAAPDEFLSVLEEDLKTDDPASYGLMRPAGTGVFSHCPRAGLLWALEDLAWNPQMLPRAALVLAQLAEIEIDDNWANKPIHSLVSIFRVWMPQTTANHDSRLRVMILLADKFPTVAWKLCIELLDTAPQIGFYNHKPSLCNDAHGFGKPFKTWDPIFAFRQEMINMVLNWKVSHTWEMLCDLVQHLHGLSEEHQTKVWALVKTWADAGASDVDKAFVREKIRVTVISRHGVKRAEKTELAKLSAAAKASYQALEPSDLLYKHEWLFRERWVEESADALHDDDTDSSKREGRITNLRTEALRELFEARGLPGVFELAEISKTAPLIGWLMAKEVLPKENVPGFLLAARTPTSGSQSWAKDNLIIGALRAMQDEGKYVSILKKAGRELSEADFVRLLILAPFRRDTWQMADKLDKQHRQTYWNVVIPDLLHDADEENNEAVERLLGVQRPRAAFAYVRFQLEVIGPELLFRLMSEMAKGGMDKPGHYQLEQYDIEEAFALINKSPVLTLEQKAGLEFAYIDVLSKSWAGREGYGIPNLGKYVEAHPELFVQTIVWRYKRRGEGEDPPEWRVPPEQVQQFAQRGYKLLNGLDRIPGRDDLGELQADKLSVWVKTVRDTCAELGRLDIADVCLGKLLSAAPPGKDGLWPCEPVRQVMEEVHSKKMMEGAHIGVYNSRGMTWHEVDSDQERLRAERYFAWANEIQCSHPFVASQLLMSLVKTYEHEANRIDNEASIRRRLGEE